MASHRVEHLELTLAVAAGAEASARPAAERFARSLLERAGDVLEERHPGWLFLVRELPLRLRVEEATLASEDSVKQYAASLAEALEEHRPTPLTAPPPAHQEVAVFTSEVEWRAAHLVALARGADPGRWYFARLQAEGAPLEVLARPAHREQARQVLLALAGAGVLPEVMAALPPAPAVALARALEVADIPLAPSTPDDSRAGAPLAELLRAAPASQPAEVLALVAWFEALHTVGTASDTRVLALLQPAREVLMARAAQARRWTRDGAPAAPSKAPRRAGRDDAEDASRDGGRAPSTTEAPPESESEAWRGSEGLGLSTRFGGLFYLLGRALELGVGEALFHACVPEGVALFHALRPLLGGEEDPAPLGVGGLDAEVPLPAVSPSQHQEFARALLEELATALPRRTLAALPEVVLSLHEAPTGRLLLAQARGSACCLFAWPAPSIEDASEGLRVFLAAWPASAPPLRARPGLAELERTGRLKPDSRLSRQGVPPWLVPASTAAGTALLTQLAGSLVLLFAARAGDATPAPSAVSARWFAVPAELRPGPETLTVTFAMEHLDLALRRVALDSDPGWVPWLGRTVRFVFEGGGEPFSEELSP